MTKSIHPENNKKVTFEVVINTCHGGFGMDQALLDNIKERKGHEVDEGIRRDDPDFIAALREMQTDKHYRGAPYAELYILTVTSVSPLFVIREYDGFESVETIEDFEREAELSQAKEFGKIFPQLYI